MEKVLFKEEQRFTQWWLWLLVSASFSVPLIIMLKELAVIDEHTEEYGDLLISMGVTVLFAVIILVLFFSMKLVTEITSTEVRVKFPPLKMKWKIINLEEIEHFEVKEYSPIKDFGGYGYRKNLLRKNDAYNVNGKIGLLLQLKNGKKLLIGTQRKQSIEYAMKKVMNGED